MFAQWRGVLAEELVTEALQAQGWCTLARNWRGGGGEIDVIVRRDDALRFVEVKEREPDDPIGLEAVTRAKQLHLSQAAEAFLAEYTEPWREACFLVVLAEPRPEGWEFTWIDNAFDV